MQAQKKEGRSPLVVKLYFTAWIGVRTFALLNLRTPQDSPL